MSKYKYGVSFNCRVLYDDEIGGGEEGDTSLDYVGNDLDKIEQVIIKDAVDQGYTTNSFSALRDHEYVGRCADIGGKIVSVIVEHEDDELWPLCVIFTDPDVPVVIE